MKKKEDSMKKSSILYITMLFAWTILAVFLWINFAKSFKNIPFTISASKVKASLKIASTVLLGLNAVFISYFWLNGVKDFIYVIWYYCNKNRKKGYDK